LSLINQREAALQNQEHELETRQSRFQEELEKKRKALTEEQQKLMQMEKEYQRKIKEEEIRKQKKKEEKAQQRFQEEKRLKRSQEKAHDGKLRSMNGVLAKQGKLRKEWHPRWFRLADTCLYYYKMQFDKEPKGSIDLKSGVTVIEVVTPDGRPNCFRINTSVKDYTLSAASAEEKKLWVEAIRLVTNESFFSKIGAVELIASQMSDRVTKAPESLVVASSRTSVAT